MRVRAAHCLALTVPLVAAACSGAPAETTASTRSEVGSASQSQIPLTKYNITVDHINVLSAQQPPSDVTYDSGFNEWGELGVRTISTNPAVSANPFQTGCMLGAASAGARLSACGQGSLQNGPFNQGQPLTAQVTVGDPSDKVYIAFALDDVVGDAPSGVSSALQQAMASTGDLSQAAGATIQVIAEQGSLAATGGGILAAVGSLISVIADGLGGGSSLPTGGELFECAGGLVGQTPATSWCSNSVCQASKYTYDTIYLTNAALQSGSKTLTYLTTQDLANLTAYGTATLQIDVAVNDPTPWQEDGVHYPCSSSHQIFVTIARDWTTGVSPSPKSADSAATSTPTENDAFFPDLTAHAIDRRFQTSAGWQVETAGSNLALWQFNPIAATSRFPGQLDVFWVDEAGSLDTAWWTGSSAASNEILLAGGASTSPPAFARLTSVARTPGNLDVLYVANNGGVYDEPWGIAATATGWTPQPVAVTPPGVAPAGGGIAAVSRSPTDIDVIFVDNNGTVQTTTSSNGGGTWSALTAASAPGVAPAGARITEVSPTTSSLSAFFVGNSGALYQSMWTPANGQWSTVAASPTLLAPAGASVSAVSRVYTNIDVAFLGNGGAVEWASAADASGTSAPWSVRPTWNVSAIAGISNAYANLSLVARTTQNLDVFFQDFNGNANTATWSYQSNTWTESEPPGQNQFTANPSAIDVAQNGAAIARLEWSGPWVAADQGADNTFSIITSLPAGIASIGYVNTAGGTLQIFPPLATPQGRYPVIVTATDAASGVSQSLIATVDVGPCVPLTCSAGQCGTISETNNCGGTTPVTCGGCPSGQTCSGTMCCPEGQVWSRVVGGCACPENTVWNPVEAKCVKTCSTLACLCQAQGGEWDGKTCE